MGKSGHGTVARQRVRTRLLTAVQYPIALLIAPAGFGKTTAIRDLLQHIKGSYLVETPRDCNLQQFIAEFARVLELPYPEITAQPDGSAAESGRSSYVLEICVAWATRNLRDLSRCIAVDNLHHAESDDLVVSFIVRIADATKNHIRWILSTRTSGSLPVSRWLAYGDVDAVVSANDLRVTVEEALEMADAAQSPATIDDIKRWVSHSNGFVVPIAYAIRLSAQRGNTIGIIDGTRAITFSFLAEEMWRSTKPFDRNLLEVAAFLPAIHFHAYASSERPDAASHISRLRSEIPFLELSTDGIFTMHDLFRDFIKEQVALAGPIVQLDRQKGAIQVLAGIDAYDAAFKLLLEIGDIKQLLSFGENFSDRISSPSTSNDVISAIQSIPAAKLPTGVLSFKTDYLSWKGDLRSARLFAQELIKRRDVTSGQIFCAIRAISRAVIFAAVTERTPWLSELRTLFDRLSDAHKIQARVYEAILLAWDPESQAKARDLLEELRPQVADLEPLANADANSAIAHCYFLLRDFDSALQAARNAASSGSTSEEPRERARTLDNLGLILFSVNEAEVEQLFEPLRDVVEETATWSFSHVSHWLPALYYALKGDGERARAAGELQSVVIMGNESDAARLSAMRRHSKNLADLVTGAHRAIVDDYVHVKLPALPDVAYEITVDAALAYACLSDFVASDAALNQARDRVPRSGV